MKERKRWEREGDGKPITLALPTRRPCLRQTPDGKRELGIRLLVHPTSQAARPRRPVSTGAAREEGQARFYSPQVAPIVVLGPVEGDVGVLFVQVPSADQTQEIVLRAVLAVCRRAASRRAFAPLPTSAPREASSSLGLSRRWTAWYFRSGLPSDAPGDGSLSEGLALQSAWHARSVVRQSL